MKLVGIFVYRGLQVSLCDNDPQTKCMKDATGLFNSKVASPTLRELLLCLWFCTHTAFVIPLGLYKYETPVTKSLLQGLLAGTFYSFMSKDHPKNNWTLISESNSDHKVLSHQSLHGIIFEDVLDETLQAEAFCSDRRSVCGYKPAYL